MRYYPMLLDLHHMHCLVVGAGDVGLRKISGLLAADPARVTAVDPLPPSDRIGDLVARHENFSYQQRPFVEDDVLGFRLVFACTASRRVNALVGQACKRHRILCNMTDRPDDGDFVLPASITRGDLTISVSTSGASPALARIIRQDLDELYGPEYEILTRLLGVIRPALLDLGQPSDDNRDIFRQLAASPLPQLIKTKDHDRCREVLRSVLPSPLHPRIGEWCDDCFKTA
jgi:precorrin-2 dehydrogenase/sirohydrochlorin ferrochelatase